MTEYRSNNFNQFSHGEKERQKKKTIWKKILFWLKIVLYVFLFGITMTGCVQSCVIKSSNHTGNGIEFFPNKNEVPPRVETLIADTKISDEDKNILQKNNSLNELFASNDVLRFKNEELFNYHLSYKNNKDIIDGIRKQHGDSYGAYKNWNSAIQLRNQDKSLFDDQVIVNTQTVNPGSNEKSNKFLFATKPLDGENNFNYQTIYDKYKEWNFIDPSFDFNKYFKYNQEQDRYIVNTEKFKNGTFVEKFLIGSGKNSQSIEFEKPISYLTITPDNNFEQYAKYRRDIFETLALKTFESKNSKFYKSALDEINNNEIIKKEMLNAGISANNGHYTFNDLTKFVVKQLKENSNNFSLSPKVFLALKYYTSALSEYTKILEFKPLNKASPLKEDIIRKIEDKKTEFLKQNDIDKKNKIKQEIEELEGYLSNNINFYYAAPGTVLTFDSNAIENVPFAGDEYQRVIYDWNTSWKLGPFYGLVVFPIAWVSSLLARDMPILSGWGTVFVILIITVVIRLLTLGLTFKQTINQSKQEEIKSKKAKIDAKYADFKNNKQMKARQQQEVADLYKKNGINPLDAFLTILISFPLFFAIWRVIQSLPEFKSTTLLGMSFAETSWRRLFFNAEWQYLIILTTVAIVQGISQMLPFILNKKKFKQRTTIEEAKALKKQNKTQKIMMFVFFFITLIFTAGVQVYWVISGLWTIAQTLGIHYFKKSNYYRRKYINKIK
ncbi:membrane protein insertase YidC [Mycoplasma tauri]|uniref:Membrane protein insertase YidC n=1 Tax=Mycoplasma tauri TaxID=547987 RepID=A0A953NEA8_9MOLU|nr:membrane protein insertase YidC [Mycoplasma tauri]MBZ4195348.1 membrane protein insertase YidC [Mycoplasma tauri]MBZ4203999.1 membrane protein insertase YidC [Mycoplasma tauri]